MVDFAKFPIHAIYHKEHEIKSNGDSKDGGFIGGIVVRLFFDRRVVKTDKILSKIFIPKDVLLSI